MPKAIADLPNCEERFLDNVLIYIGGFIMRALISKEKCTMCYTYLTECKERVSCHLINVKQLGGLQYPTLDVVSVLQIANRTLENALTSLPLPHVFSFALEMTKDIVAEILSEPNDFFTEIAAHDPHHKMNLLKKIVFHFISLKGKHFCRTKNIEDKSLVRHKNTKEILFKHE